MTDDSSASYLKKHHGRLARVIEKNIHTIIQSRQLAASQRNSEERLADSITDFSGRMYFVYFHVLWFVIWILINLGYFGIQPFDPYPFGLLTMIVSLEAIFLSTFVLISQNRLAQASEKRAELDLQVNLLAEQKATKVLELLDQMTEQLDRLGDRFNFKPDPEVKALKVSPEPQEVLQVIEETVEEDAKQDAKVREAVEDVTDEVEAVHDEVKRTSGKLAQVAEDVEEIKREVRGRTGE